MYKFLCTDGLGLAMRQNELIELALTFDFQGIEIDMADMVGRAESMGMQFATQFVNSADVDIATFRLPIDLRASDDEFAKEMERLDKICELSKSIKARQCYLTLSPSHPSLTYHENFEKHRSRIYDIGDQLQQIGVRLGVQFIAVKGPKNEMQFIHKPEELVALIGAINHKNVGLILDTWNWQLAGTPWTRFGKSIWPKSSKSVWRIPPKGQRRKRWIVPNGWSPEPGQTPSRRRCWTGSRKATWTIQSR